MSDLSSFILARLEEQDGLVVGLAGVSAAFFGGVLEASSYGKESDPPGAVGGAQITDNRTGQIEKADCEHIAYHDPSYVLADIASKRAIVALVDDDAEFPDFYGGFASAIDEVLQHLARPFSSHPDYQTEWAAQ